MADIVLTDNTRYFVNSEITDDKIHLIDNIKFIGKKLLTVIKSIPHNPLTTNNIDGVEFLEKDDGRKSDTLILKVVTKNGETYVQTGNMIGEFYCKKTPKQILKITIALRFDDAKDKPNKILEYLLNYANEIYPNEIDLNSNENSKKSNKIVELLLTKMFTNSLAKANVMGFPTMYQEIYEKDYNVRGSIDIQRLISQELPFKGKTPYVKNERVIIESIGSVLLAAISILQDNTGNSYPILSKLRSELKQSGINNIINHKILNDAIHHRALDNPLYSEYKTSLYIASMILKGFKTPKPDKMQGLFYGYLVDISKIWENYLVKFFESSFSEEWEVKSEVILNLFSNCPNFTNMKNEMRPDIVLYHKTDTKKVMVFDAKFKSSKWFNREDFYKTVAYVSHYQNNGYEVVLSGQIYPDIDLNEINKNIGLLDTNIDFRFFGIDLFHDKITDGTNAFIKILQEKDIR